MIRQIPPSVTYPSPNEFPVTYHAITGITKARQAQVTAINHGLTSADIGITFVDFTQVKGMTQINGKSALVQSVIDADNITVNIDSSNFGTYSTGGFLNILTGQPPTTTSGFQIYNTPFENTM